MYIPLWMIAVGGVLLFFMHVRVIKKRKAKQQENLQETLNDQAKIHTKILDLTEKIRNLLTEKETLEEKSRTQGLTIAELMSENAILKASKD